MATYWTPATTTAGSSPLSKFGEFSSIDNNGTVQRFSKLPIDMSIKHKLILYSSSSYSWIRCLETGKDDNKSPFAADNRNNITVEVERALRYYTYPAFAYPASIVSYVVMMVVMSLLGLITLI